MFLSENLDLKEPGNIYFHHLEMISCHKQFEISLVKAAEITWGLYYKSSCV